MLPLNNVACLQLIAAMSAGRYVCSAALLLADHVLCPNEKKRK